MPDPLVSVVLPVRDGARTVRRAIESILRQTLREWELIVIDDGSTDGTGEILAGLAQADARVRVLTCGAGGLVSALNAGIDAARAPLIARMDADDESHPQRLQRQLEWLASHPDVGLVGCVVEFGGDRAANEGYARYVDWINSLLTPDEIALNRFVESPLAHPSVLFRRELVTRHGGYRDGDFPEDYELWLRWLDAGVRFDKSNECLLTWHDSAARLSRSDARYAPDAFFRTKAPWIARELARCARNRPIWVWGAGRATRKRAAMLMRHGVTIAGYVDVDAKKHTLALGGSGVPVIAAAALPSPGERFVLGYVTTRGARDYIRGDLVPRGYVEGADFLMCA